MDEKEALACADMLKEYCIENFSCKACVFNARNSDRSVCALKYKVPCDWTMRRLIKEGESR